MDFLMTYNEDSIQRLKPMNHIRSRPHLYLTSTTGSGRLHEVFFHVLDYPLHAAFERRCNHIKVTLHHNHQVSVEDDGEGMEVSIHKYEKVSMLELDLSEFATPGRRKLLYWFDVRMANAYSDKFTAEVRRDGYLWRQEYQRGEKITEVTQVRPLTSDEGTGTTITFTPDFTILEPNEFDYTLIANRLREFAFLIAGLSITLHDERTHQQETFYYPHGLHDFVRYLNVGQQPLHETIHASQVVDQKHNNSPYQVQIEFVLQYTTSSENHERGFANIAATAKGTYLTGFRAGLTKTINQIARKRGLLSEHDRNFTRKELMRGLTAVVSVHHPNIALESISKVHLINPEMRTVVSRIVAAALNTFAQQHPEALQHIIEQFLQHRKQP
jgi:DNA gyrase subunit B